MGVFSKLKYAAPAAVLSMYFVTLSGTGADTDSPKNGTGSDLNLSETMKINSIRTADYLVVQACLSDRKEPNLAHKAHFGVTDCQDLRKLPQDKGWERAYELSRNINTTALKP